MAKQTFTTGQVLTAAQMTSLQQTAMGGGAATAKTASYVLVAADAGTTVAMNAAGATTITVNTGLFAAGDTVFIQNLGAGACTVTAGTATVATAGSLILPQNDAGILYFTSASAAIFYDYIQAGAVSPLTTKGDLYTFSTSDARLGVGANGTTLVADSSEATGLKWAAASGGGWTSLASGSLSGTSTSVNITTTGYYQVVAFVKNVTCTTDYYMGFDLNTDTGNNYSFVNQYSSSSTAVTAANRNATSSFFVDNSFNLTDNGYATYVINDPANTTAHKMVSGIASGVDNSASYNVNGQFYGRYMSNSAITNIRFQPSSTFSTGTYEIYGVK